MERWAAITFILLSPLLNVGERDRGHCMPGQEGSGVRHVHVHQHSGTTHIHWHTHAGLSSHPSTDKDRDHDHDEAGQDDCNHEPLFPPGAPVPKLRETEAGASLLLLSDAAIAGIDDLTLLTANAARGSTERSTHLDLLRTVVQLT